eukprot:2411096-Pyramimonas_sp.AAC.1
MPARGPKKATRRIQVLLDTPSGPLREAKLLQCIRRINDVCLIPFSLPMRFAASRWPLDAP